MSVAAPRPPKAFLSHATEDKERFVLDFARRLRESGIDVWLDKWEMFPGDSLVDKIFEEGLRGADAVIVVLSRVSVTKPWVREELNAATVKRISTGSMLIPVVIDECAVPEALHALVWQKISNLDDYTEELGRIVASITSKREKPPLGPAPGYTKVDPVPIPGLSRIDGIVLQAVGDEVMATGDTIVIDTEALWARIEPLGVPRKEFEESLLVLSETRYLEEGEEYTPFPTHFSARLKAVEAYARAYVPNYQSIRKSVVSALLNLDLTENDQIASQVKQPMALVNHILDELASHGLVRLSHSFGGHVSVDDISPRLRRALRAGI